jgi:cyclophilin family peptidyl-prolyl cis-trans isomerase
MFFELTQPRPYEGNFLIELAPLDAAPHAVHLFLEQVAHGLWNQSTYFYLNGPHVLQAGPSLDEDEDENEIDAQDHEHDERQQDNNNNEHQQQQQQYSSSSRKPFEQLGLDQLAFPDYSDKFPHVTWTLGFTGRPGGPDFYINKVNNTEGHGPGGQYQHALEEQGDACFGKVVSGKIAVSKIFTQPVYNDGTEWHYFLDDPVKITGAVIWKNDQGGNNDGAGDGRQQEGPENSDEMVNQINEKLKRRPRLPKIDHAVEP